MLDAGGARDVHLRQLASNDIEADEDQPIGAQARRERLDDTPIVGVYFCGCDLASYVDIAAQVAALGHAQDRAEDLPVHQQHALVSADDLRDQLLEHRDLSSTMRQGFYDRVEVPVILAQREDALAPVTVDRFDHGFATDLAHEGADRLAIARHERLRCELGEGASVELLIGVAQPSRVVQHERMAAQPFEHQGQPEVASIEGGVFAHEDSVHSSQIDLLRLPEGDGPRGIALHRRAADSSVRDTVAELEVRGEAMLDLVASTLCFEHQREGGILIDEDGRDGIHDEDDAHLRCGSTQPSYKASCPPMNGPSPMRRAVLVVPLLLLFPLLAGNTPSEAATPTYAGHYERYAVAADHPLASEAGATLLEAGGTAADAAAATMLALGVVNPGSSGLGGGGFALYYRASDRSLTFLDFRERAPAAAHGEMFVGGKEGEGPLAKPSQIGGLSSGVPGEPAGIAELVSRFGKKPLSEIVEPARRLAQEGFTTHAHLERLSTFVGMQLRRDPVMRRWIRKGEAGIIEGQTLRQPELAKTLRAFGKDGAATFYRGAIAKKIVEANRRAGGVMTLADLEAYRVVERAPLRAQHFGLSWVTAPPPSAGGYTMLQSLAFVEALPTAWRAPGVPFLHALAESWKGPFLDRQRYFGDPDHVELPIAKMLSAERRRARVEAFHPTLAQPVERYNQPIEPESEGVEQPEGGGTSHLCVVDAEGNVASVTTTINLPFGARYTAAGIVMNDEMDDFARQVGKANAFGLIGGARNLPAPGKRPVSTMTPTIVFAGGDPILCIGAAGGSRIVTGTEQVALRTLLSRERLAAAIAAPRVHHQGHPRELQVSTAQPLAEELLDGLRARGHRLREARGIATVQAVHILRDAGAQKLEAASDPAKGGRPAGR